MSFDASSIPLLHLESVDSTSDEARRLLADPARRTATPFVVWADRQTQGRGRSRRIWWSDEGSLTFTVALDPSVEGLLPHHIPRLSLLASLAILDTVDALGLSVPGLGIRWPNDVEVDDRKLAGLLPESIETPSGRRILIGVGLNLSTRFDEAPPEIARMGLSLSKLGLDVPAIGGPRRVLGLILEKLSRLIPLLASDHSELGDRWNGVDLLRGRRIRVSLGPTIVSGVGVGVGPDGALRIVPDDGGKVLSLVGGQVLRDLPPV